METTTEDFKSFKEYHTAIFDEFVEYKYYRKLEEFIILCDMIEYFRENIKDDPKGHIAIECYVLEMKEFANTFIDLCDEFGYSDDNYIMNEYADTIFAL